MRLYFGGSEIPAWRNILSAEGVTDVSLSFYGMRRRVINLDDWLLDSKYPDSQSIFLDSGAFSVNKPDSGVTPLMAEELARLYMRYVELNADRAEMVSEFDALALCHDVITRYRNSFYSDLGDKFIPVWHPEHGGFHELERLCSAYSRVLITEHGVNSLDNINILNTLAGRYGTKLHGALTRIELMKKIRWDSVGSTSWMSPKHYKDTTVWTGTELKRYPMKYKDQARRRHRSWFEQNGFDADKIANDDDNEILRLSIWSWKKFVEDINSRGVTTPPETMKTGNEDPGAPAVDTQGDRLGNAVVLHRRETTRIPVMGTQENADGDREFRSRSDSMRLCNTCSLRNNCPGFEADSNCLYDIPITVRTPAQIRALYDGIIEMQSQRVMFMQMHEQLSGGYVDDNLSREIDRLQRLVKAKYDFEREGFTLKVEASGPAQSGMISRIFGNDAARQLSQAEHPVVYDADNIIEAEILSDRPE